jgi:hypothetical protein
VKALVLLAAFAAAPALASDGVESAGPLSDADLLRLLTCGAVPGGPCQSDPVIWPDPGNLTIGFGPVPAGYPAEKAAIISRALDAAILAVNGTGTSVHLRRVAADARPNIALRPTLFFENDRVTDEPGVEDGAQIGAGYVYVYWNASNAMTKGTILIAQDIWPGEIDSIVLEEVSQSLGFLYDIENPDYEGLSIFAQNSNSVTTLTGQDAAVLRLYYPK